MKKIVVIALIATFLLTAFGVIVGVWLTRPQNTVSLALSNTLEDITSHEMIESVMNTLAQGSLTLDAGVQKADGERMDVSGTFYTNMADYRVAAQDVRFSASEREASLTLGGYLGLDHALIGWNDSYYGIDKTDAWANFSASDAGKAILGENARIDGLFRFLISLYENSNGEQVIEEYLEEMQNVLKAMLKLVSTQGEWSCEKGEFFICRESVSAKKITLYMDDEAIETVIAGIVSLFRQNEVLRRLAEENDAFFAGWCSLILGKEFEEDPQVSGYDFFLSSLEKLCIDINDQLECAIQFFTKGISPDLLAVSMRIKTEKWNEELFSLQLGAKGIQNTSCVLFVLEGKEIFSYNIKLNDADRIEAEFATESNRISYEREKKTGNFALRVQETESERVLLQAHGTFRCENERLSLRVDGVDGAWVENKLKSLQASLVLQKGVEIPSEISRTPYRAISDLPANDWKNDIEKWKILFEFT